MIVSKGKTKKKTDDPSDFVANIANVKGNPNPI
jgi:hypothetical protein